MNKTKNIIKNILGDKITRNEEKHFQLPSREDVTVAKFLHIPVSELRRRRKKSQSQLAAEANLDEHGNFQ